MARTSLPEPDQGETAQNAQPGRVATLLLAAVLLLVTLTWLSLRLIAPDLLQEPCNRPQLVAPEDCS